MCTERSSDLAKGTPLKSKGLQSQGGVRAWHGWWGGAGCLTRRAQEDVHEVLIEDEGGRSLREQVEADGGVYCRRGGCSAPQKQKHYPRLPCPLPQNPSVFPSLCIPQPGQQLLEGLLLHPQDLFWEGADGGSAAIPSPPCPCTHKATCPHARAQSW